MDETIVEILSRHLDGDLDADEERELFARLEAEPALTEELEAMRRIRRSVAALAHGKQWCRKYTARRASCLKRNATLAPGGRRWRGVPGPKQARRHRVSQLPHRNVARCGPLRKLRLPHSARPSA